MQRPTGAVLCVNKSFKHIQTFPCCDQREQPCSAFFEKEMGGSGGRGKTFFLVKKSFSSSPRFPQALFKNKELFAEEIAGAENGGDAEQGDGVSGDKKAVKEETSEEDTGEGGKDGAFSVGVDF